jgi:hypothetical protein
MSTKCLLWTGSACVLLSVLCAAAALCRQVAVVFGTMVLGGGVNVMIAAQRGPSLAASGASTVALMAAPLGQSAMLADLALIPADVVENVIMPTESPRVLYAGFQVAAVALATGLVCFGGALRRRWQGGDRG